MFRRPRTTNERRANALHVAEGFEARAKRKNVPQAYDDISYSRQNKSWKDRQKKRKQYEKGVDRCHRYVPRGFYPEKEFFECPTYPGATRCACYGCPYMRNQRGRGIQRCLKHNWAFDYSNEWVCWTFSKMMTRWEKERQEKQRLRELAVQRTKEKKELAQLKREIRADVKKQRRRV